MPSYAGKPAKYMNDELVLFQIASKSRDCPFYYRINLPEQDRVESLVANAFKDDPPRYTSLRKAFPCSDPCAPPVEIVDAAIEIYREMRARMLKGQPIVAPKSRTVSEACKGLIKQAEVDVRNGIIPAQKIARRKAFYERFIYPYKRFGENIATIDSAALMEWQNWRDRWWISGDGKDIAFIESEHDGKHYKRKVTSHERRIPAVSTKNSEWVHLKAAFDWAAQQAWISAPNIPRHYFRKSLSGNADKNPAFTLVQWQSLEAKAIEWINQPKLRGDNKRTRQLCWLFALTCRAYGLRVAEAYTLKKKHIIEADATIALSIGAVKTRTSGKHERTVEPIYRFRRQMLDLFTTELPTLYKKEYGRDWGNDDWVWMHSNGTPIKKFYRGFESLLKFAQMTEDPQGHNYNLTSLRHSAITEEIEATAYNIGLIAVWAGTSSVMIDKHYNQAIMRRAKLQERQGMPGAKPLQLLPHNPSLGVATFIRPPQEKPKPD